MASTMCGIVLNVGAILVVFGTNGLPGVPLLFMPILYAAYWPCMLAGVPPERYFNADAGLFQAFILNVTGWWCVGALVGVVDSLRARKTERAAPTTPRAG